MTSSQTFGLCLDFPIVPNVNNHNGITDKWDLANMMQKFYYNVGDLVVPQPHV